MARLSISEVQALDRSDLNLFLFADIGVEGSGMTLSVISALARLGLDPWQEAARLARLPRSAAVDGLARLIAGMPASLWPSPIATPIATRLVALLPRRDSVPGAAAVQVAAERFQPTRQMLLAAALAMAVLAGFAVRFATRPGDTGPAPAALSNPAAPAAPQPTTAHAPPGN